jgi:hypothetical protein
MPYFRNEQHYMISEKDIAAAIQQTLAASF